MLEEPTGGSAEAQDELRRDAMALSAADADNDQLLDFREFCALIQSREGGEQAPNELRNRFDALDLNGNGKIEMHEYLKASLRDALSLSVTRVLDLLAAWDTDRSGDVSRREFRRAIRGLGFDCAGQREVDAIFDEMDVDGSGKLDYREMLRKIREFAGITAKGRHALRRGVMSGRRGAAFSSSVKLDPSSDVPICEQLRDTLAANAVRVIDLFRDWDEDGDGNISFDEFCKVMPLLVQPPPSKFHLRELFATFDADGSGCIDMHELEATLRRTRPGAEAFKPWVAREVAGKLRGGLTPSDASSCLQASSTLALLSLVAPALPPLDRQAAAARLALDEAHRRWMMPMKGHRWTREPAAAPHFSFGVNGRLPPLPFASAKQRTPMPPLLIKPDTSSPRAGIRTAPPGIGIGIGIGIGKVQTPRTLGPLEAAAATA